MMRRNPAQSGQVDRDSGVGMDFDLTFLSAANATFIAEMNAAWRRDPSAVDKRWAAYFEQLNALGETSPEIDAGPSWARSESRIVGATDPAESVNAVAAGHAAGRVMNATDMRAATLDSLRAVMLIRAYRIRGHLLADLDRWLSKINRFTLSLIQPPMGLRLKIGIVPFSLIMSLGWKRRHCARL